MVTIRLQRVGRKNDPSFRVVVTDRRAGPQSGKFIEIVGAYDARRGRPVFKEERIKYWLAQGAQVSNTVHNLLVGAKLQPGPKIDVAARPRKKESAAVADKS